MLSEILSIVMVTLTFDLMTQQKIGFFPFHRGIRWPSLVKIQYTELMLSCGNDPVVKNYIYSNSDLDLWPNDPKINTVLPLPQGRIQDFKLGGGDALKKIAPRGGRHEHFWGYFVWKITILCQKIIFFPIAEGAAKIFGVFRGKIHDFTPKNHIFSQY
jgi:hypothetical protein